MTYVIVARWRPRPGEAAKIDAILQELVPAIRAEPGNLEFIAHRSNDDPNEYLLYEQYKDEQAFLTHRQTPHFKTLVLERAVPLLEKREIQAFSIVA
jgi:quinol monooxygenase YgiN